MMNILFAASEMAPFCKTGGLADVIGALPPVLAGLGHRVTVILPGYSAINRQRFGFSRVETGLRPIPVGLQRKQVAVEKASFNGVTIYLLDNGEYFSTPGLYGDAQGDYRNNGARFIFYARGALELAKALNLKPDVIHAHDWLAGLVPAYLATLYKHDPAFAGTAALFTIHNLGYQGLFPFPVFPLTNIPAQEFTWRRMEFYEKVSFIKSGIVYADAVSTVSPRYAEEITREPLGFGLQGVLEERKTDLHGILNGIDEEEWNPATDKVIAANYSLLDTSGKKKCRKALLDECGFTAGADEPVFGMVTRLDSQKGLDILGESIGRLVAMDIRIIILGAGAVEYHDKMRELAERYHDRLCVTIGFDTNLARRIYGGSDAFLMPSRYEPCGLGQLIALRYGTLPVAHETGGLADTVFDIDKHPQMGNGFMFCEYTSEALIDAVTRAARTFRTSRSEKWKRAMERALAGDYSWASPARKYVELYTGIRNRKTRTES